MSKLGRAALAVVAMAGCVEDPNALLLSIRARQLVETFDITVRDLDRAETVLDRLGEPVDPDDPNRDISQPGQELRLAIEFERPGSYRVHIVGRAGQGTDARQFALHDYQISGLQRATMTLIPLAADEDVDGFPACEAKASFDCKEVACEALDCDDDDRNVNPFSVEVCGNDKDDDCSAGCAGGGGEAGDEPCEDKDGDGVGGPLDCDDEDPCRSPEWREVENLCNVAAEELPELPVACGATMKAPYCGDGIDQDCNGQDLTCRVDDDCDEYSPPEDCNDQDPEINRGATEVCDGVDNNCNEVIDEGCVPCDVDGDSHAAPDVTDPNCTDDGGELLPRDDPDDFDSGVHPETTADSGGAEGGTVLMALRRYCSYELTKSGEQHREVDHDGDEKVAADDGCPEPSCDVDGDGFAGPQCSPPKSLEDCDDSNHTIFPGAPDICNDTIKQNCIADAVCVPGDDGDGDGYTTDEGDCDDTSAERRPWAVELCDGIDNDCDDLIDEGNPGPDGTPIPTGPDNLLCNDSNHGRCGGGGAASEQVCDPLTDDNCSAGGRALSGVCACSRTTPTSTRNDDRVACAGEDLAAQASPRCFGALQPEIEHCDDQDWDCNGEADDPNGDRPLIDAGKACSTSVGNCLAGQVVGCDLEQTVAELGLIERVLAAQGLDFNRYWVCEGEQLPTAERCNGKDDDCDGELPDDEQDGDADSYIVCSGCEALTGERLALRPNLAGCDDCDDDDISIHPGAAEKCNGVDDNCAMGNDDDGADQCQPAETCCPTFAYCRDLSSNDYHCGECGHACNVADGETCVDGVCTCGGATCEPGQDCYNGQCRCIYNGSCDGCCDGNVCRSSTTAHCGVNGAGCETCSAGGECEVALCQAGKCSTDLQDNVSCDDGDGRCWDGSCCSGDNCWDTGDNKCVLGKNKKENCGIKGEVCDVCSASEECKNGDCVPK